MTGKTVRPSWFLSQNEGCCTRRKPTENQVGAGFSRCPRKAKGTAWPLPTYRRTNKGFTHLIHTAWWFSFSVRAEARTHLGIRSANRRGIRQGVSGQKPITLDVEGERFPNQASGIAAGH